MNKDEEGDTRFEGLDALLLVQLRAEVLRAGFEEDKAFAADIMEELKRRQDLTNSEKGV